MSRFIQALLDSATPVIAELKRRDAEGYDLFDGRSIDSIVATYEAAGAACLSVVTGKWFGGSPAMLRELNTTLPVLQKDFITNERQVASARADGACAVLLTAALLTAPVLRKIIDVALRYGLTPFVEVVTEAEIEAVRHADECVIAVNTKNIKLREQGTAHTERAYTLLPAVLASGTPCPVVASGIETPQAAADLVAAGYRGLLIGSGLLRAPSVSAWFSRFSAHVGVKT